MPSWTVLTVITKKLLVHVQLHNITAHLLYKYCTNCTVCNWTVLTVITHKLLLLPVQLHNSTAHLLYKYCTNCTVCNWTVLTVITQKQLLLVQLHNSTQSVSWCLLKCSADGCLLFYSIQWVLSKNSNSNDSNLPILRRYATHTCFLPGVWRWCVNPSVRDGWWNWGRDPASRGRQGLNIYWFLPYDPGCEQPQPYSAIYYPVSTATEPRHMPLVAPLENFSVTDQLCFPWCQSTCPEVTW
jgi:hypothetical protein